MDTTVVPKPPSNKRTLFAQSSSEGDVRIVTNESTGASQDYSDEEEDHPVDDARVYKNPRNSPSQDCPRDEDYAEFMGQKCLRKCSNDEDCKSKKKKCYCDGLCGMSCIKAERECDELESPSLGHVILTGRLFGDKATYTCQIGYHLVGPKERLCRGDGNWSGTAPQCKQTGNVYCGPPPKVEHARHNAPPEQNTFQLDTTLLYQCHHGYITNGFHNAKCLAPKGTAPAWYGPDMTCEPRSCGAPIDPTNGWHSGDCYTFGCKVTYNCGDGFELVGRSDRACQADGSWSPRELPACVLVTAVECPAPESPQHGTAVYTSCAYNSVVSYECRYGYTLVGDQTRRCGADRKWTGQTPKCQEINCGIPGPVYNGWIENTDKGTGLGASLIFRCQENMLMVGNASSVCQLDGTWRYPPPLCLAPCVVPAVPQGRVEVSANGSLSDPVLVQHGSSLRVHCEPRYEPNTANNPVICNNGTWSHIPRCLPARCKFLPRAPKNGMVIAPKTDHGMKARFRCRDGYTIRGENTTECKYGNWTGELPYCQEVYCPFPGYVENGKVLLVGNMGLYDYRPYVRKVTNNKQIMYECDKGYTLVDGPPGATCVAGHWSPKQLPRCVPGMHPRLRWSRSVRERRDLRLQALERLRRFKRALVSSTAIRPKPPAPSGNKDNASGGRGRGGSGNKGVPGEGDDEEEDDDKDSPTGATVSPETDGNTGGTRKSNKGRIPGSQKNRTKVVLGPPCETIPMEPFMKLELVRKGRMANASYSHGALIKLTCATGYIVNLPNNTARCNKGKWKPDKPKCNIAPCFVPHSEHGIYTKSLNGNLSFSGTALNTTIPVKHTEDVEFSCKVGYNVQGPGTMKCWYGQWKVPILPTCTPAPCQLPVIPNGQYLLGYRPGLTIGNGSQVRFQCDTEYKPSTPAPILCTLGELRPKLPSCKKDPGSMYMPGGDITKAGELGSIDYMAGLRGSCGPPARVQGTLVYKNGEPLTEVESFPDGTEVTFHCIANIMGEKVTWRIICEDGNWLGRSLSCESSDNIGGDGKDQGVLSFISNGPPSSKDNSSCIFYNSEPNVATFYNDKPVTEDFVEFTSGAVLLHRCADIGKFAMIGSPRRRCYLGEWDGLKPSCFGLNQENDYAMDKPPTILFRHENGPIAQSNDGKLIVYPSTTIHMECLWIRRFGTPKWVVSHSYRKYPEEWSSDPGRDNTLEYRLSVVHAVADDSGNFTCTTPTRHSHSVEMEVRAVHCDPLPARRGLRLNTQDTKMNTRVLLNCANGNSLIGAHEVVCLPSGNWSAPVPVCESMECPDLGSLSDVNLRASILSREVGGQVVFSCSPGFGLSGPAHSTCLPTGEWAQPIPACKEVQCPHPPIPENGNLQGGNGVYKAGDLVQFTCNQDHMMEGQPILACQENGRWSSQPPKCVKACSYPGTVISGRMSTVKFYYQIGESVAFTCDSGLNMIGASMLRCLKTGKWSAAIPTCIAP